MTKAVIEMRENVSQNNNAKFVAKYGMLIALAMIFSYVEAMIPLPLPVGAKLGLANLVSVIGLYIVGIKGTIAVSLTRIILVGFTFGNMYSMIYGLSGGALSLIFMIICKNRGWFSQTGVSIIGGIGHNIGQLCIAAFVTKTAGVFVYMPFLLVAGTIAGTVIGLLGGIITERIQKVMRYI